MAFMPSEYGMIKKTFTVLLSSFLVLSLLVGCSSESVTEHKNLASGPIGNAVLDSKTHDSTKVKLAIEDLYYNPNKNYGSLWSSDLFNEKRFKLNIKLNKEEQKEAKLLARSFESHMERGKVFMHYLLTELKERNLPAELAAVPLVESGFKTRARSHANAHGPWQFTRQTGKSFGLSVTDQYDEFYDFVASTEASLTYLEHLYNALGKDWELALVGYNQGEFGVKKLIRRAKAGGVKNINAQTVALSRTARTYLKRFKAYAAIFQHPEAFGVEHPQVDNRVAFKRIPTKGRVNSMSEAAKLAGVDIKTLKHLNAGYLTDSLNSSKPHGLLVPMENALRFERAIGLKSIDPNNFDLATAHIEAYQVKL